MVGALCFPSGFLGCRNAGGSLVSSYSLSEIYGFPLRLGCYWRFAKGWVRVGAFFHPYLFFRAG